MRNKHEEPKQPIIVLGDRYYGFELKRWREALMRFLDLVWAGKYNYGVSGGASTAENRRRKRGNVVIEIQTNDPTRRSSDLRAYLSISFDSTTGLYQATGGADSLEFDEHHVVLHGCRELGRGCFESMLAQFARNRDIHGVVLPLTDHAHVRVMTLKNEHGRIQVGIQ